MWTAPTEPISGGQRCRIRQGGTDLSFRELFNLLEEEAEFAAWYTELLAGAEFAAYFWEHPPLTAATYDHPAEFVLLDSPTLARLCPEPEPFQAQFARYGAAEVATFPNLGGDAVLVVPRPVGPADAYGHLAAFVRRGPAGQVRALWAQVGRMVRENLGPAPRWLSTAGLGVSWLHIRLDSRPKYYRFGPYKAA